MAGRRMPPRRPATFSQGSHHAIAASARDVLGRDPVAAGENAWMDAALMQGAGIATLSVGASGDHLHAPDELVSIPELVSVVEILEGTILRYCG